MEEHRAFKPLDTMANPLGLCQFYCTDPETAKSVPAPKPLATTHKVKHLLEKARGQGWPYIIVIFEGGNVTPLGLLQELHSWYTLSCIPTFTAEEAKWGQKPHELCCPLCAYFVKNDSVFLSHIVIMDYWCNYAYRRCLDVVVTSSQQMKKHFLKCHNITDAREKPIQRAAPVMVVSQAASHLSHTAVESLAPSPKRTRVTNAAMRKRVTRCMGQRSPKPMVKWLLKVVFRRVHVKVCTLLGQAEQAEIKKMWAKCHPPIGVTRS